MKKIIEGIKKLAKWYRIYICRKVTVLDVLEYSYKHRRNGLCWTFDTACDKLGVPRTAFDYKCRKFNRTEAAPFNAAMHEDWWWPPRRWDTGREAFLKYLINYYSNIDPIYV